MRNPLFNIALLVCITCFAAPSLAQQPLKTYISLADRLSTKDFDSTIIVSREGMSIATRSKDSIAYAVLMGKIGKAHYFKGNYDSAAFYYFQSANILQRQKSIKEQGYLLNDWARLYRKTRDFEKALSKYDAAMALFRLINDSTGIATIYNESGVVFEYQKNYAEALKRYNASLVIAEAQHDQMGVSYALNFIAGVYVLQEKFKEAEAYNLKALSIRQQLKDTFSIALSYSDLGSVYAASKQWNKAIESYNMSNALAMQLGYAELLSANYAELAKIYKELGNYALAYESIQKHNAIKDSIFQASKSKMILELSTKYETEKNKLQLLEQSFQIRKRNYWLIGLGIFFILSAMLGYSFYKRYRLKKEKQLQEAVFKQQELATKAILEAEENERKRIAGDLHDGVGQLMSAAKMNLSAIESEIPFANDSQRKVYEKAQQLVDEGCREVRSVSHNMMPNALLKAGLASAVREFLNQIDSRVIKIDLYIEGLNERIDSSIETVLYRIIQESVNNVIKHSGANHLDISLIKDEDGIAATIEDNGKGFDIADRNKFEGIGLKNIKTRIEYLKGTVEWDSSIGKGTLVAIHVPLSN